MAVAISFIALMLSTAGLLGAFGPPDTCFWTNTISLVLGLWMHVPSIKSKDESGQKHNIDEVDSS
jgi:hypothetical protein